MRRDGVLSIGGYPDVKAAIDGKQPNFDEYFRRQRANVTSSGTISATGNNSGGTLTASGVLNIAGYSNVKTALDTLNSGKQDNLTAASTDYRYIARGNGTVAAPSISFTANTTGYVF
jgi:hypothetical protein